MAKPLYLVGKPGDQKFKRNIPTRLQSLAGKTAFVERVHGKSAAEIRQQGSLFAVMTDAQMRTFEAKLASGVLQPSEGDKELNLNVESVRQIAVSYFLEKHQAIVLRGDYFAAKDDPDFPDFLSDAGEAYSVALRAASGDEVTTDPKALDLLVKHGIISSTHAKEIAPKGWPSPLKDHRMFQYLCRLMEQADLELADRRCRSLNLGTLAPISHALFVNAEASPLHTSQPSAATDIAKTVADLKKLFLGTKVGVTRSRSSQYRIPFRVLEEQAGNLPLANIDRDKCRELMDFLPKVPSHAAQHYPKATLQEAAELYRIRTGAYADRHAEAQKHVAILKSAFDLAKQEGWVGRNPWDGIKVSMPRTKKFADKENTYEPFTISDLNKLFALPLFVGCVDDEHGCHTPGSNLPMRHRYWVPIVALWTGMRMNEILQLEKGDIRHSDEGIAYIQVTDYEHGQYKGTGFEKRLKTSNSVRSIPVHSQLIEMGFLRWVENSSDGRLFPEAVVGRGEKPSDIFSKRFKTNLEFAGVWKPRRRVFHSFRNSFNDALRNALVVEEIRNAINGWSDQKKMDAHYGDGHTIKRLHEAVELVSYHGLDVRHLVANASRIAG